MAGRMLGLSLLAAVGFLLLFSTGGDVGAVTYKMGYSTRLSCNGPDGTATTLDDSCVPGAQGAYSVSLTADIISRFSVPNNVPKYSNYKILRTFGTPSGWKLATDKEIPDGAAVGRLVSLSTLALFGGDCTTTTLVTIPMYDCTTDIAGPKVAWDAATNGKNLLQGKKGGLPIGCTQYPQHALDASGGLKPRARYMGATVVTDNNPPTQLQFLMFSPQQLAALGAPQASIGDELGGYTNFVVLNNPAFPAAPGDSLDEFCTQLESNTTLWGKTGGQGALLGDIAATWACPAGYPCVSGNFWTVGDACNNTTDDDGDNVTNEMCGIQRVKNPAAGKGAWGTGTQLDGAYGESYLDIDGDGTNNVEDECPYAVDVNADPDGDHIDSVCDPTPTNPPACPPLFPLCHGGQGDEDNDGWRNQQDNCPLNAQVNQLDTDSDNIGDVCDLQPAIANGLYVNDQPSGGICIGEADSDGDGFCDSTENLNPTGTNVLSLATNPGGLKGETDADTTNCPASGSCPTPLCSDGLDNDADTFIDGLDAGCSVPEYTALDFAVVAAVNQPGSAPRTCNDWSSYDSTVLGNPENGVAPAVNQDRDALTNAADPNCGVLASDTDQDGVPNATDNCVSVWNPTQLDTDSSCITGPSPGPSLPGDVPGSCGDACETDDDADNIADTTEWAAGSDAKNVCDPVNFDTKPSNTLGSADIIAFIKPLLLGNRPCFPATNYNVCR